MDLKEEAILGAAIGSHWYYVAKGRALCAMLGGIRVPEVLDVGAGSGVFSRQLLDAGVCSGRCASIPATPRRSASSATAAMRSSSRARSSASPRACS